MIRLACKLGILMLIIFVIDTAVASLLKKGLESYQGVSANPSLLLIGNSKLDVAVDAALVKQETGRSAAKLCLHGLPSSEFNLLLHYCLNNSPVQPSVIVYGLSYDSLVSAGNISSNHHQLLYPYLDDRDVEQYLKNNDKDRDGFYYKKFIKSRRYNTYLQNIAFRGLFSITGGADGAAPVVATEGGPVEVDNVNMSPVVESDKLSLLDDAVRMAAEHGALVIFMYIPDFSGDALYREVTARRVHQLQLRYKDNAAVVVYDGLLAYQDRREFFRDRVHMNRAGSRLATDGLIRVMRGR